jgi:hypothetical protein
VFVSKVTVYVAPYYGELACKFRGWVVYCFLSRLHRFCCVSITAVDGQVRPEGKYGPWCALIVIFFLAALNDLAGRYIHQTAHSRGP